MADKVNRFLPVILFCLLFAIGIYWSWAAPPVSSTANRFEANTGAPTQGAVPLKEYFTLWLLDLEKFYEARFLAQEKAILKQEESQKIIDEKNNNFRKQMDQMESTFARKSEVEQRVTSVDITISEIRKDIASLRESRSAGGGRTSLVQDWVPILISLAAIIIAYVVSRRKERN